MCTHRSASFPPCCHLKPKHLPSCACHRQAIVQIAEASRSSSLSEDLQHACCEPQYAPNLVHLARKITAHEMLTQRQRYNDVLPGLEGRIAAAPAPLPPPAAGGGKAAATATGGASSSRPESAAASAGAESSGANSLLEACDGSPRSGNGVDHRADIPEQARHDAAPPDMEAVVQALVLRNGVDAEHPMMQALCNALRASIGVVYASGNATARVCTPPFASTPWLLDCCLWVMLHGRACWCAVASCSRRTWRCVAAGNSQ